MARGTVSREDHSAHACDGALVTAFSLLGKRWNGMILGALTHGGCGFAELRRGVAGISDSVLSERLTELSEAGLVHRDVDPGPPTAVSYTLTPGGKALVPVLDQLSEWARANLKQ